MPPSESELSMFGLTMEEAHPYIDIWPDNVETVTCFIALSTQWKVGVHGVTGLDYSAIPMVMEMNDVQDNKRVFHGLQIMESEALRLMRSEHLSALQ